MSAPHSNLSAIADYVARMRHVDLPGDVLRMAKQSLVDWYAACFVANGDRDSERVSLMARSWNGIGRAVAVDGTSGSAPPVALINGTYSHAMEYDDFHIEAVLHIGAPTFAALLALAMERRHAEPEVLRAFATAFEVAARLGMGDRALSLGNAGWHPTCIVGHISAAIACASLMRLEPAQIAAAVGFAAAQASGLQSSSGTIAKPLQIGKAALAGVIAAMLAEQGADAPSHFLETGQGLFSTLVQRELTPDLSGLGTDWQMLQNSFKPYSACQLTHAPIEAGRAMRELVSPEEIRAVRVFVNPFALTIAGREKPATPLQCRFSIKHVTAMSLLGHGAAPGDFTEACVTAPEIVGLSEKIAVVPSEKISRISAVIEIDKVGGGTVRSEIAAVLGSAERPMRQADTERKFRECARARLGDDTDGFLDCLINFERPGTLDQISGLLQRVG